ACGPQRLQRSRLRIELAVGKSATWEPTRLRNFILQVHRHGLYRLLTHYRPLVAVIWSRAIMLVVWVHRLSILLWWQSVPPTTKPPPRSSRMPMDSSQSNEPTQRSAGPGAG